MLLLQQHKTKHNKFKRVEINNSKIETSQNRNRNKPALESKKNDCEDKTSINGLTNKNTIEGNNGIAPSAGMS